MHLSARTRRGRAGVLLVLGALVATLALAAGLGTAATTAKPYSATVSPTSVGRGSTTTFLFTVTNLTNQGLGSANVTVPSGWTLVSVGTQTTSPGRNWKTPTISGSTVQLRAQSNGDRLLTGESVSVQITATAPCSGGGTTWGVVVKQSNNFNGSGNDFYLSSAPPTTALVGSCHLAFNPGATDPSKAGDGLGIEVELQDGANQPLADSTTMVTLAPASGTPSVFTSSDPSATALSSVTRQAAGGVVDFSDVSIHTAPATPGATYTLTASAAGYTSISTSFVITPADAHQLAFAQQPTTTVVGTTMSPAVTVRIEDRYGNLRTGDTTAVTLGQGSGWPGGTLSVTSPQNASGGIASFGDISVDTVGTGFTLLAGASGLVSATSDPFDVVPPPPDHLVVDPIPLDVQVDTAFTVTVRTANSFGDEVPVTADTVVRLSVFAGSGTLDDANQGGVQLPVATIPAGSSSATFSVTYSAVESSVVLRASDVTSPPNATTLTPGNSNAFNVDRVVTTVSAPAGAGAASGETCTDATRDVPVCLHITLPNGANGGSYVITDGTCSGIVSGGCVGTLVGAFFDVTGLASKTSPVVAVVEFDKSLNRSFSNSNGVPFINVFVQLVEGGPFVLAPNCTTNGVVNADSKFCVDARNRDGSGDSLVTLLLDGDARIYGH
jgi:hypothetical protein